jgi:hypothetical protein
MRLATFNVENMFDRAAIMNLSTWKEGKKVLQDFSQLSNLIQKQQYLQPDKDKILAIMKRHKGLLTSGESKYILLRKVRGRFLERKKIVANGRDDWIGWFDLKQEHVKETAVENTARVARELNADVFCVIEAEHRTALNRFNDAVIPRVGGPKVFPCDAHRWQRRPGDRCWDHDPELIQHSNHSESCRRF